MYIKLVHTDQEVEELFECKDAKIVHNPNEEEMEEPVLISLYRANSNHDLVSTITVSKVDKNIYILNNEGQTIERVC